MSAFLVSENHIHYLVNAAMSRRITRNYSLHWCGEHTSEDASPRYGFESGSYDPDSAQRLGAVLWLENHKSVTYRYSDSKTVKEQPAPDYHYKRKIDGFDPVQVLKAIDCYEYQASEHPEYKTSEARNFCQALRKAAISSLAGYDEAAWGIE